MMFWLGFFVGIGAASTAALIAWTIVSHADPDREASCDPATGRAFGERVGVAEGA